MNFCDHLNDVLSTIKNEDINSDCFSKGQLKSKEWAAYEIYMLQDKLKKWFPTMFILCGWYGLMATMLYMKNVDVKIIRSFDIDENACDIADKMNKTMTDNSWAFKAVNQDINEINFNKHTWQCWSNKNQRMSYPITDSPDLIINTSCEHTDVRWYRKIPKGKMVLLQSNDFFDGPDHVNCVINLKDMKATYPMTEIHFSGMLKLEKYTRFMLIGER